MKKFVAYYRVSTAKQGASGLGLESQRNKVRHFTGCMDGSCIDAEYLEVESGKKDTRPELLKAIAHAKRTGATLIIAKLDRLSRNAGFIFALRDSGVDFVCADIPDANTLTIGIFAVMAQHERELISERTKCGLESKKQRIRSGDYTNTRTTDNGTPSAMKPDKHGVYRLGNPDGWSDEKRALAAAAIKEKAATNINTKLAIKRVAECLKAEPNSSLAQLAERLNEYNLKTPSGKPFGRNNVQYIRKKAQELLKQKEPIAAGL